MTTRHRIENVGSFLRPAEVRQAREAHQQGRLTVEELRQIEDRAILSVLEMQQQVGLPVFTDGEFRRESFSTVVAEAIEGFATMPITREWRGRGDAVTEDLAPIVVGKLHPKRRIAGHEASFLKRHAPGPFKITLPTPNQFPDPGYRVGVSDQVYASRQELLQDLTAIVSEEVRALVEDGVSYIQLDAPRYSYFMDPHWRQHLREAGVDIAQGLRDAIAADNICLQAAAQPGVTRGFHLCRGNARSRWYAEGGYESIAEAVFGGLDTDVFLLEYDSDRAGGFEPLRFVPRGKTVVLGLVTTKEPELESQDDLLRRIDEASQYVPMKELAISTQCGFASGVAGNLISHDDQRRKLDLVVDTARKAWA
jgi:5-methyltetrahydropteroyltriglutamate--homocysteine methyltransferase